MSRIAHEFDSPDAPSTREPAEPFPVTANDLPDEAEFTAWYGPWEALGLPEITAIFTAQDVRWWVAGGLAVEAFTGVARPHADIDVALARPDLPALRALLPTDLRLWEAHNGSLTPLFPGNGLYVECEQLWVRREATQPWLFEILLSPVDGGDWVHKRDSSIRMPLREAVFHQNGVPFLAPQAVLLHKARLMRPKDVQDFEACLPKLDLRARDWLRTALDKCVPEHPWRSRL